MSLAPMGDRDWPTSPARRVCEAVTRARDGRNPVHALPDRVVSLCFCTGSSRKEVWLFRTSCQMVK